MYAFVFCGVLKYLLNACSFDFNKIKPNCKMLYWSWERNMKERLRSDFIDIAKRTA